MRGRSTSSCPSASATEVFGRAQLNDVSVSGPIQLGAFLKVAGAVATGGEAKWLVQSGSVKVNGSVELRRGHRLADGDLVALEQAEYRVCRSPS